MRMKIAVCFITLMALFTQSFAQRQLESLDRGLVAVSTGGSDVFLSWRLMGNDPDGIAFNIYRGSTKVNTSPITGATNIIDKSGSTSAKYSVRPVIGGVEQAASKEVPVWASNCLTINLQRPSSIYAPNDINVSDLDGDGEYELVVKYEPNNTKDNSQSGTVDKVYLHAYKLNGTCLWKIDLGVNIRGGAHYTQHQVYDYDGDGFAEVACKTAPGTKDGTGAFLSLGPAANDNDNEDYRNSGGYILSGPEYLTVFNGKTGKEMATVNYMPARGTVSKEEWGDAYGNRVDRFNSTTAWLDGKRPSMVFQRGYYYRLTCAAWDWRDGKLTQRWFIDSRKTSGYSSMNDQGNHGIMAGDVDNDGKDEVIFGASALDHDGKLLYANGMGHGDAGHIGDMDPSRQGLELWLVREGAAANSNGSYMADPITGKAIWGHKVSASSDVGRGIAADVDASNVGYEMWSSATDGTYNCKGTKISSSKGSMNFRVYWDGDLQDELLDGNVIDKWNGNGTIRLATLNGNSCNGTKKTPNISADLLGDWREEVILHDGASKLYLYTTTISTTNRLYTLMHDPVYRAGIASQQSAYNQPPHLGFFLGNGADKAPKPNMYVSSSKNSFTLTTSVGQGEGSITPASGAFEEGQAITVTAVPASGWIFDHWSGDLSGNSNPATLSMTANKTVSAYFAEDPRNYYTIAKQAGPGGSITQTPDGSSLVEGTDVTLSAVPNTGWTFLGWSGDYEGTNASYNISSLNRNISVTASFMPLDKLVYQAEVGVLQEAVLEAKNAGFTGESYVNFNAAASSVQIPVYADVAGQRTLKVTFANGSGASRELSFSVNGTQQIASVQFEATADWTTWESKQISLSLPQGASIITLATVNSQDGPNIDKVTLDQGTYALSHETERGKSTSFYNAAKRALFIQAAGVKNLKVSIYSLSGKRAFSERFSSVSGIGRLEIPVKGIRNGMYILRSEIDGTVKTEHINLR
ncbi:MAG: pseudouridine synthase [Fibrobacter sp.]|nr:pseudouridine synthase [Fibrobacter sp.]